MTQILITTDIYDTIYNKEVKMSVLILNNGWNIGCLLNYLNKVDFRNDNLLKFPLDDMMHQHYQNILFNEYQLIFIKGNRVNNRPYYLYTNKQSI